MKSIRRSLIYVLASICGIALFSSVAIGDSHEMGKVVGNLEISGNVEVNTNYETSLTDGGTDDDTATTTYSQAGRTEITFKARKEMGGMGGRFAYGQGAVAIDQDGAPGGGDYFFQYGGSNWDIVLGKKGGEGVYSKGQDIAVASAPDGPAIFDASNASKGDVGGINLNFTASDALKFQVRVQYGNKDDDNQVGFRPWVNYSSGGFGIHAAYDNVSFTPKDNDADGNTNKSGYALKLTGTLGSVALGVNFSSGMVGGENADKTDQDDVTTNSAGGFATVTMTAGSLGAGHHQTSATTDPAAGGDSTTDTHTQTFVSWVMDLPVTGAAVKLGYGVATAVIDKGAEDDLTNSASIARIRFNFTF